MYAALLPASFLLERDLGPFRGKTRGENFFGETFDGCQSVAGAGPWRGLAAEVRGREHVVAGDLIGAVHFWTLATEPSGTIPTGVIACH